MGEPVINHRVRKTGGTDRKMMRASFRRETAVLMVTVLFIEFFLTIRGYSGRIEWQPGEDTRLNDNCFVVNFGYEMII
jgi:hypothetical protein